MYPTTSFFLPLCVFVAGLGPPNVTSHSTAECSHVTDDAVTSARHAFRGMHPRRPSAAVRTASDGHRYAGPVSDLAHELPLFGRPPVDESAVTSDWKGALADVIHQAAAIAAVEGAPACAASSFVRDAGLAKHPAAPDLGRLETAIRAGKPQRVRALSRAVTALLALARSADIAVEVAPRTAGAVSLHRTGAAPLPIRAVIAGHTLRATDADWSFGRGPVLQGTSMGLLSFLCGLSNDAPRRAPAPGTAAPAPGTAAPATLDE